MKLLFDQNLSHRLVKRLADVFPDSEHVRSFGLQAADDDAIWTLLLRDDYVLVTKDEDFFARSLLQGPPPWILWVRSGNCATDLVETLLRKHFADIQAFCAQAQVGFLPLY